MPGMLVGAAASAWLLRYRVKASLPWDRRWHWLSGNCLGIHGGPNDCVQHPDVLRPAFNWGLTQEPKVPFWPIATRRDGRFAGELCEWIKATIMADQEP
jgi:hypothetical protein